MSARARGQGPRAAGWRIGAMAAFVAAALAAPRQASAQVGFEPAKSPYTDVYTNHELALYGGWYFGGSDPAGVAPHDGLATGLRYGWHAGGPAILTAELARFGTHRTVKNPNATGADRIVGDRSWPLYSANIGLDLALTGEKSWHRMVPLVKVGVGMMSDMKSKADTGGFKFGTRFAFNLGAGIRWVPATGHWGLRADFDNRFYTVAYPLAYFLPPSGGGSPILQPARSKSSWTVNPMLSLGLTYNFGR